MLAINRGYENVLPKFVGSNSYIKSKQVYDNRFDAQKYTYNPSLSQSNSDSFLHSNTGFREEKTDVALLKQELEETKSKQTFIGKLWDGFKNLTKIGAGSKKAEQAIKDYENGLISKEEMQKATDGYKEGQKMVVDVVADVASGILAVGAFAFAVPTGGASLGVGLGLATAVGAGVKIGIKAGDAAIGKKEYTGKDLLYDTVTGGINGLLAPVTNGIGNSVTKTIGTKLGLTVVKEGGEEIVEQGVKQGLKQGVKSIVLNQTTDVVGGTITKRAISLGAGMAVDGALSGASDNMIRAALNGEDIVHAGIQGAVGGAIAAPIIGGGFRVASKAGRALNNKITTKINLPDGVGTKFKQGQVGDCALLATIDGMINNPETSDLIKKSITKTIGGDYNVKIGDRIIRVSKSQITDEMLSDVSGIRIFEQAYKQISGDLDGGFADAVAKQFGLNPVHITQDAINDELLDRLAREQGNNVLSLGALVDGNGTITSGKGQRHYFTIKKIDPDTKTVRITSTVDTSKHIDLSYADIKKLGISIDGGTIKKTDLPNFARDLDDELFRGVSSQRTKKSFLDGIGQNEADVDNVLGKFHGGISTDTLAAELELYGISPKEAAEFIASQLDGKPFDVNGEKAFNNLLQAIQVRNELKQSSLFSAFNLDLQDTSSIIRYIKNGDTESIYDLLLAKNGELTLTLADKKFYETSYKELTDLIDGSVYKSVSSDDIASIGVINGKEKQVILPDSTTVQKKAIPKGQEEAVMADLIKSNMVTQDIVDALPTQQDELAKLFPSIKKSKIPQKGSAIEFDIDPIQVIQRAQKDGIDSLSSHEIHVLTDMFSDLYKGNNSSPQFQNIVNSLMKNNSKQFNNIYSYVEHLKGLASPILKKYGIEIEDHAFMRMLDRNMLSVVDNKQLKRLNFAEYIELLAKSAKSGQKEITGYNGSHGIKMITKQEGGKVIIDSVM